MLEHTLALTFLRVFVQLFSFFIENYRHLFEKYTGRYIAAGGSALLVKFYSVLYTNN